MIVNTETALDACGLVLRIPHNIVEIRVFVERAVAA